MMGCDELRCCDDGLRFGCVELGCGKDERLCCYIELHWASMGCDAAAMSGYGVELNDVVAAVSIDGER
jgi:hypothetical protein